MQFRILGSLEVLGDRGAAVALGGRKPRAVLAVLLLHANEPVSAERLAGALWGEDAPAAAVKTVHVHVSRLRKALGDGGIVTTTPAGYQLHVQPGELDAERFEQLVEQGRRTLAAGRAGEAAAALREAESLWHGPALADLAFEPFAQTEIARLEEQRLAALELRVEADVAAGRHTELVSELRRLVAEHPTRERLVAQLMLALYRSGRQTEALEAYREARTKLADEIGVEPGPELRAMHDAVLHQDPALDRKSAPDLPHELEAAGAAPLAGRDDELSWLKERWEEARAGHARLVVVAGARGMGKTRLAAELAIEAHRAGAEVVYASGQRPAQACLDALGAVRSGTRPLLAIADDLDRSGSDVVAAVGELRGPQVMLLATATQPEALSALETDAVLFLKRLGSAAIGTIAALYAPDQAAEQLPVERLLTESGGVPGRVHHAASRWARVEARQRVSAIAGRAAEGREELRSMEDQLAGGVVQLQTVRDWDWPGDGDADPVVCPFKGLASFEAADARYFFGRERLVAELVARLVGAPVLGVVGPSGSGKSSVVRAGLLPALAAGVLPQSEAWPQVVIRPGEHPLQELRGGIDGVAADRFVLAVDQFEETFTVCRDEAERSRFISEVVRAAQGHDGAVVVLAIRADFYGRCADYPALARLLAANHVLVGSMRREELRRAVVGPAQRAGLNVEPDLVEALVHDVDGEPGALPLLSTALLELWQRRDGRRLRLAAYEDTGGVLGAVGRLAEDGFGRLDEGQKVLARRVLLRLAAVEPEGGVERRRLPVGELEDGSGAVAGVIGLLADARLLTVSAGTVEFAHEALLREWPRLRGWIEENREDLRVHRSLSSAGQEWMRLDRDDDALLRGARLAEAAEWAERADPGPTEAERAFLTASLDREQRDRRARRRNLAIAFSALALGILAIAAVAIVALDQRHDAVHERNVATSRQLGLESGELLDSDPELGLRLALLALDTAPTEQAGDALRRATLAFHPYTALNVDPLDANAAAYSPDGDRLVTGGAKGRAAVWDVRTRRRVAELPAHHDAVDAARFSPAGDRIAVGFADGTVVVADDSLAEPRVVLSATGHEVANVAFSGDGERVAVALSDGTVRVLAADGQGPGRRLSGHRHAVRGVDISADGSRVVSAGDDGTVRLWNLADGGSGQVLYRGALAETDVAFSPDGSRILGVGDDRRIRFWNARTGAEQGDISGEGRELTTAAFSADGRRFAVAGRDGAIRVWSTEGGPPVAVLRGHRARVLDVGFGATSDRVVSAAEDGTVRLWDAGRTQAWTVPSLTNDIEFNRDGRRVATGSEDGTVRVWDPITGRLEASLDGPDGVTLAKFSPTEDTVLITNSSRARLWPIAAASARVAVQLPRGHTMANVDFDGTGRRIVYVDDRGHVVVRDLQTGRDLPLEGTPKKVLGAVFSPDSRYVAAAPDRDVLLWRVDRPARPLVLKGHNGPVNALDISRDNRILSAGTDGTLRIWNTAGRELVRMQGHQDEVTTAVFAAGDTQVLSSGLDGSLRLFDARTGEQLAVLQSAEGELYDVALSSDGKIATLGKGEVVRVFPCDICGSLDRVRSLAVSRSPRPLSAEERKQFLAAAD